MEVISDIKNSIGYINVNQALKDVFGSSIFLIEYEEIGKGESDSVHKNDFRFIFKFKRWKFVLDILDTRIKGMMNSGNVGGRLSIFIQDFDNIDDWAPYRDNDGINYKYLRDEFLRESETWNFLRYEGTRGNNLETMKKSLQILKDYLDEQIRLKREEEDRNSFGF